MVVRHPKLLMRVLVQIQGENSVFSSPNELSHSSRINEVRSVTGGANCFMNIHAPDKEIREQFLCFDWVGKRWIKDGKTYIRAKHRTTYRTFYYCFEDNFAWFPTDIR